MYFLTVLKSPFSAIFLLSELVFFFSFVEFFENLDNFEF